jgi:Malectin domain
VKHILGVVLILALRNCVPVLAQTQAPVRVNCGGPQYTDSAGQAWQADTGYNTGTVSVNTNKIAGTTDAKLFQSGRWNGDKANPLTYVFAVAEGTYHVNLYFAESTFPSVGARIFNVGMQGQLIFQNLDIYATAKFNTALIKGADITVTNGELKIEFDAVVQNPKVNAIEIVQTASAPEMIVNFVYPDGTPVTGTLSYQLSTQQISLGGSSPLSSGRATCYLFTSPAVLGLIGTFQVNMNLADGAGRTLWQVNMSMDPTKVDLGAVQSSSMVVIVQRPQE